MAASAYKGLTIRIGADTTKLTSALRGVNSAIYKTQSEFRKLSKAAKLDPGNNKVISAQMGAVANMAVDSALKMERLKKSIAEVGSTSSKSDPSMTIGQLADATENAALDAEMAKERYNSLTAEIERVSDSIKDLSGIDPSEAVRASSSEWERAKEAILDWAHAAENEGTVARWEEKNHTSIESTINDLEHLRDTWVEASNEFDDASLVQSLHNARVELTAEEATLNSLGRQLAELDTKSNFGKSFGDLDDQLKVISSAADTANDRLQRMNNAVNMKPGNIGLIVERAKALADATEVARAKSQALQEKINSYKANGVDKISKSIGNVSLEFEKSKKAFSDAATETAKLEGELVDAKRQYTALVETGKGDGLQGKINAAARRVEILEHDLKDAKRAREEAFDRFDTAKMCKELQEAETEVKELETSTKSLADSMDTNLSVAAVHAAAQIGQLMREAGQHIMDSANDVDAAYRDMRKTVEGTEEQYKALYDAAMEYSQTHVTSADTMLEMEALAGQVGITADALQNFSEVAANLDVATDIDAEDIALKMGQMVNVMSDLNENNVRGFADALVDLGNKMPAQESAIMQIAQRLSSVGDVAGFTTPQVVGWAAAIASTGQRSEAAATGISTTITSIQSAVSKGGEELDAFAKVVGKSADEFKREWGKNASKVLEEFIAKLQDLGPEAIAQLEDLGIEGVRQTQTLLGLAKTVKNVGKAINISEGAWNGYINGTSGIGAAAQEAQRKAEGFSGSLAKMQNSLQVMWASLGPALKPVIDDIASGIQSLTEWFNKLDDSTKTTIVSVGAAFAAFAIGEPIIGALIGNIQKLAGSAITKAIAAFITAKKEVGKLNDAFLMAKVTPLGLSDALAKTGSSAAGFAKKATSLGTAFMSLASSGVLAAGAIGAVALAVGAYYIKKFNDAKKRTEAFNGVIDGIKGTTSDLHRELLYGKDTVEDYGKSWSGAGTDIDEFIKSQQEHVDAMNQTRDESTTTIGMLQQYKDIIDECAGAGEVSAEKQGQLEWALKGLEEATGNAYSASDILAGSMKDEEGNAIDLKKAIDDLIQAKKKESQINALTEMRTEAVKGQMEAKKAIDETAKAYQDYAQIVKDAHAQVTGHEMTDKELRDYALTSNNDDAKHLRELLGAMDEATKTSVAYSEEIATIDRELGYLSDSVDHEREGIMRTDEVMKASLDNVGITGDKVRELAEQIMLAGVSADDFASIASEDFALMAEQSGGDIQKLTDLIANYNAEEFEDKYGHLSVDGYGNVVDAVGTIYEWNGTEFVPKFTTIEVEGEEQAEQAAKNVAKAQDDIPKKTDSKVNIETKGTDKVKEGKKAIDDVPKKRDAKLMFSVFGKKTVEEANRVFKSVKDRTVTLTYHTKKTGGPTPAESATGAYIPYNKIPKHAAGIFTQPTLTNIGWVGEDGAELYSGNSLVPLTNRKYSMPYINDISDAVAKKLGGSMNNAPQISVVVNGVSSPEETARAITNALNLTL